MFLPFEKNPRNQFKMGNNFSKRILPNEKAELWQEMESTQTRVTKSQAKKEKKNLKTLQSLGDLEMNSTANGVTCYKIDRTCSGQGCSKYWSFLPRL